MLTCKMRAAYKPDAPAPMIPTDIGVFSVTPMKFVLTSPCFSKLSFGTRSPSVTLLEACSLRMRFANKDRKLSGVRGVTPAGCVLLVETLLAA